MSTNQQLKLLIAVLLVALAGTIYYYNAKEMDDTVNDSVCMNFKNLPPSTLKTGLIGDMVSIYKNNQLSSIKKENGGVDDARSIWFDLDTIKKFIYHIEKAVENNSNTPQRLGIRFYYASYPDDTKWGKDQYSDLAGFLNNPKTKDYEFKHTLVLLPTIGVGSDDLDFNPLEKATYTTGLPKYIKPTNDAGEPVDIDETAAGAVEVFAITSSATDRTKDPTPGRNHGALYPPGNPSLLSFE